MPLALIRPAIAVAQQIFKHRKAIYAVLTAQDRYISKSFRYGGYGKATSYGVRSGALAGSIAGAFINNAEDSPGNAIQKPVQPVNTSRPPHKTRGGFTSRTYAKQSAYRRFDKYGRCPRPRKQRRM